MLILATCALAVAPAAYASWRYATQTVDASSTASRSASRGCSVQTHHSALRLSCYHGGAARATYAFRLPSGVVGKPAVAPVPGIGPYTTTVRVSGSTAYVTVSVTHGTYTLRWVNLVYYVK